MQGLSRGASAVAEGIVMNKPVQPPNGFPLGINRFLKLEQRVSDIEKNLETMITLVKTNNDSLQSILDAIEKENGN